MSIYLAKGLHLAENGLENGILFLASWMLKVTSIYLTGTVTGLELVVEIQTENRYVF